MTGPILIFDKSVLDCLKPREALLLQRYFNTNITPILLLEVLANLKEPSRFKGVTQEQYVTKIEKKIPFNSSNVNADHSRLTQGELLGRMRVEMKRVPVESKTPLFYQAEDGRKGLYYDESDEEKALAMWRDGKFSEMERLLADYWKKTQKNLDLNALAESLKKHFAAIPKFKDLQQLKDAIVRQLDSVGTEYPAFLMEQISSRFLDTPLEQEICLGWWKSESDKKGELIHPKQLVPYSYYLYTVELFYNLGLAQGLIKSAKKSKTHIDLQYLYYLPFCMTFASDDGEHKKMVPPFLADNQNFMSGKELKADLSKILAEFDDLSDEEKAAYKRGYPPDGSSIAKTFDSHGPGWRNRAAAPPIETSTEKNREIVDQLQKISKEASKKGVPLNFPIDGDEVEFVIKMRRMSKQQLIDAFDLSNEKAEEIMQAQHSD